METPPPTSGARVTLGLFCYNQARFLGDCLSGLRQQGSVDLEVFLVDDGSSDDSLAVLTAAAAGLSDCTVIADGGNRGLPDRMQQVVDRATGEWLIWVAADDALLPGAVARLLALTTPAVDVVWGDLAVMDEAGRSLGYYRPAGTWQGAAARRYRNPGNPVQDLFRVNNFVPGGMTLIRRRAVQEAGGYPAGLRPEDLNMWLTLGPEAQFRYLAEPVGRYRVVPGSGSRDESFALRNQAAMAAHHVRRGLLPRAGLARLLAMRWALGWARTRGRPPLSLGQLADLSGLSRAELIRELPSAGIDPIRLSAAAWLRRHSPGHGPRAYPARLPQRNRRRATGGRSPDSLARGAQ